MTDALVDLHMHTTCSDGAWAPNRLFQEIRERRLEYFCISDHDNMEAYPVPADLQSRCIAGLEIDTYGCNQTLHVLAYGMKRLDGVLMSRLRLQRVSRESRAQMIVERLNRGGINLTFEQVLHVAKTSRSIGRPHIARALVEEKYCSSIQSAFDDYLAEGRSAYVPLDRLTTQEAIDLIRQAGALAILAHPRRMRDQTALPTICRQFDGLEVIHPTADTDYERHLFELVGANEMLATGGSDFHARPGENIVGVSFPRARLSQLLERLT